MRLTEVKVLSLNFRDRLVLKGKTNIVEENLYRKILKCEGSESSTS